MVRFSDEHGRVYTFPIFRLKDPGACLPSVIPAKEGIQRRANGKTGEKFRGNAQSTGTFRIWVPAFAGMAKSGIALRLELQRNGRNERPDFVAVYPILLQEAQRETRRGDPEEVSRMFRTIRKMRMTTADDALLYQIRPRRFVSPINPCRWRSTSVFRIKWRGERGLSVFHRE